MIELQNLSRTFRTDNGAIHAVRDVNLTIEDGEIFGVIGYSGAGKSTLVRCLNLLERPDSGKVLIDDVDLVALTERDLRSERQKMGMIFQQFNLMASRNVFDNVAFSLRYKKIPRDIIRKKVLELLDLVGISDKINAYPAQLSGGQKQRVAIARALASDPKILLCDEATSALDPQTTKSILKLIRDLNKKLGLTVVIITHEMSVIKEICHRVAVMEDGYVVELNDVISIFSQPQQQITKDFIRSTSNLARFEELVDEHSDIVEVKTGESIWRLDFYGSETKESIVANLTEEFGVKPSIIFANVEVIQDTILGSLIVRLAVNSKETESVKTYLAERGIRLEVLRYA